MEHFQKNKFGIKFGVIVNFEKKNLFCKIFNAKDEDDNNYSIGENNGSIC